MAHFDQEPTSAPRRRSAWIRWPLGGLIALLTACGGPMRGHSEPAAWLDAPLTWDKLEEIEVWLAGDAADQDRHTRIEAELQLAEGRLAYALRDQQARPNAPVTQRFGAARGGFEWVQRASGATAGQRDRARMGLDTLARAQTPLGKGPQVLPRSTWNAQNPNTWDIDKANGRWSRITVHHTAMPARNLQGASASTAGYAVAQIQSQHMEGNGWADIGYHFMIDPDGRVWEGRSMRYVGAHASRDPRTGTNHNLGNIGVCLLGNFETENPSSKALASLESLLDGLRQQYRIPHLQVFGHTHFKATDCPGQRLLPWVLAYQRAGSGSLARATGLGPSAPAPRPSYASTRPAGGGRRIR